MMMRRVMMIINMMMMMMMMMMIVWSVEGWRIEERRESLSTLLRMTRIEAKEEISRLECEISKQLLFDALLLIPPTITHSPSLSTPHSSLHTPPLSHHSLSLHPHNSSQTITKRKALTFALTLFDLPPEECTPPLSQAAAIRDFAAANFLLVDLCVCSTAWLECDSANQNSVKKIKLVGRRLSSISFPVSMANLTNIATVDLVLKACQSRLDVLLD